MTALAPAWGSTQAATPTDRGFDAPDPSTGLRSALYRGPLHHARTDATPHAFTTEVTLAWLALEELPHALDAHPFWSARHPAPIRFRRRDFHGDPTMPLDEAVRATVARHTGERPEGPVRLLAGLRTWAWSFNPIAFYVVLDPERTRVETLVAEVTNTPWHERHAYVLPIGATEQAEPIRFPKALHVSPFQDLDLDHALRFTEFGADRLRIQMDDLRGDDHLFTAALRLDRLPLDRGSMADVLRRNPLGAQRVSAGIYRQARRLKAKGAPFRRHPDRARIHRVGRATSSGPHPSLASTPTRSTS